MELPEDVVTFANRGIRLFPVPPNSKIPAWADWPNNNSSDIKTLEEWNSLKPNQNWAAVTAKSRFFVIDLDCKNGKKGMEWYSENLHRLPDTLKVRTASGGLHLYFKYPDFEIGDHVEGIANGVDVKGGGCVIVPPSGVGRGHYEFEDCDAETEIAEAPGWLLDILRRLEAGESERQQPKSNGHAKYTEGQRHKALMTFAGGIKFPGMDRDMFERAMVDFDLRHNDPPLGEREVIRQGQCYDRFREKKQPSTVAEAAHILEFEGVEIMDVEWLWEPYIPFGMLSMLNGDPGVGKSYIALAIAAEQTRKGNKVLYMSNENPFEQVLVPRFDSLGGKRKNIALFKGALGPNGEKLSVSLQDVGIIEGALKERTPSILIIDPLQSYLGAQVDAYRANETRPILDALGGLAEAYKVSILILRHIVKSGGGRAIHKGLGSIDFTGAVRSELFAGETPDHQQKAMVHIKSNVAQLGKAQGYSITAEDEVGNIWKTGYFRWLGDSELRVADLTEPEPLAEKQTEVSEAKKFLIELLRDGYAKPSNEIYKEALDQGFSKATIKRAKRGMKEIEHRKRKVDGIWEWFMHVAQPARTQNVESVEPDEPDTSFP